MYSNNHIKPNQIELWLSWGFDKNFKKIRKQNSKFLESKYRIGTQNLSNSSNKSQTRLSVWKQNIELEQRKSLKFFLKISKKISKLVEVEFVCRGFVGWWYEQQ